MKNYFVIYCWPPLCISTVTMSIMVGEREREGEMEEGGKKRDNGMREEGREGERMNKCK